MQKKKKKTGVLKRLLKVLFQSKIYLRNGIEKFARFWGPILS